MKNILLGLGLVLLIVGTLAYSSSDNSSEKAVTNVEAAELSETFETIPTTPEFNKYWYAGEAEITSYELEQARYGEIHAGKAVLVFVTEDFSKDKQVKADNPKRGDIPVMKLNFTKNFNTGIYPYSMMASTFVPVKQPDRHAIKVTTSSQEWCGHTFTQLNNKKGKFEIEERSYFESEGDQSFTIEHGILEDELWTKIRLSPELLPAGVHQVIPSFFHLRLSHKELKPYEARLEKKALDGNKTAYSIKYPDLNRQLEIVYNNEFPYEIEGWEETYTSGWGKSAKTLTTRATKIKTMNMDYWSKHNNEHLPLRKELGLD
jgi:hypothetical protein